MRGFLNEKQEQTFAAHQYRRSCHSALMYAEKDQIGKSFFASSTKQSAGCVECGIIGKINGPGRSAFFQEDPTLFQHEYSMFSFRLRNLRVVAKV